MPNQLARSILVLIGLLPAGCGGSPGSNERPAPDPAAVAAELLGADSAFSAASARTDAITGLSAMFAPDVVLPAPGGRFVAGIDSATALLRSNPANAGRAEWTPVRVGVSADGLHGFTFGYGTQTGADGSKAPWKYLGYWVKGPAGWRVVVYRRRPRPEGTVSLARMPAALPAGPGVPADSAAVERFRASLADAERGFSDEAQRIGLGAAFAKWGRSDAVNMGGPDSPAFVVSADSIGKMVGAGGPTNASPVSWAPDYRVIVAGSGDLGVTIGTIRPNGAPADGAATSIPFFTIWYRGAPTEPWRYIAE
jgi:hypothetical protein